MEKHKIWLVDDHPLILSGMANLLRNEADMEVALEAGTREQVMAALDRAVPDAVVLDISLGPGKGSGLDMIHDIKQRAGAVPVLVMSMLDEALYGGRAKQAGAQGYLSKQQPVRSVIAALRILLDGRQYFDNRAVDSDEPILAKTDGPAEGALGLAFLSPREFEVFQLLGDGLPPRLIAEQLHLSVRTIEVHRANMRRKLKISSAEALTRIAVQWSRKT